MEHKFHSGLPPIGNMQSLNEILWTGKKKSGKEMYVCAVRDSFLKRREIGILYLKVSHETFVEYNFEILFAFFVPVT